MHVDNIAPSLFGGLVLTVGIDNPRVKRIPVPKGISAVIVHDYRANPLGHRNSFDSRIVDTDRQHQATEQRGRDVVDMHRSARDCLTLHRKLQQINFFERLIE